jgi:flagellar hook-associated protein 2
MGTITSGVGLISGIDTASLIDQLIEIEARPQTLVKNRNTVLQTQVIAYQEINAKLLSLKLAASGFTTSKTFQATAASSTNEAVLTATSTTAAVPGTYNFTVKQLVGSQQTISTGFADTASTLFAPQGTTLTFDRGQARLDSQTRLSQLNGGNGVTRGKIRITDRSGAAAVIDLSDAVTVNDVLDRINNATGVSVYASIDGDALKLEDASGATAVNLAVANVGVSKTATSLGLVGSVAASQLTGTAVNTLGRNTLLAILNDNTGVHDRTGVDDFRITTRDGATYDIDIEGLTDLGDIVDAIADATAGNVTADFKADGSGLQLTDNTAGGSTFAVTALNDSGAATDLGILQSDSNADGVIEGRRVLAAINSKLLKNLAGGSGVAGLAGSSQVTLTGSTLLADLLGGAGLTTDGTAAADLKITDRGGTSHTFDLDSYTTVQDFITAVANTNALELAIDGQALRLKDITGLTTKTLKVENQNSAAAATELGLIVDAAVNSQRGGNLNPAGVAPTTAAFNVTDRAGNTFAVNLAGSESVSDVIDAINTAATAAGSTLAASVNDSGMGIKLYDGSNDDGNIIVADTSGTAAASLGLAKSVAAATLDSGNLQFNYVRQSTRLDDLGVSRGKFTITDSGGASATVDLSQGNELTIRDVINEINSRGLLLTARINDTGDGILIQDTGPGAVAIEVAEDGSTTAKDLGILGSAAAPGQNLVGTYEKSVAISGEDHLADVVTQINAAGVGIAASVVNDGSPGTPYRLSLGARTAGSLGAFTFDTGGVELGLANIADAQDAVVFFGSSDPAQALIVTSATNTLDKIIPGASVTLKSTSDTPVQVTINRDDSAVITAVQSFVSSFNAVIDAMDKYDSYDEETEKKGVLLGDSAVVSTRNRLFSLMTTRNNDLTSQYNALAQIGITVGEGATLRFDQSKFQTALSQDPDAVQALFTFKETEKNAEGKTVTTKAGIGVRIDETLTRLTDSVDGLFPGRVDTINSQIELNTKRIEDYDELLALKRARLEQQFQAMENALALLQSQSEALGTIKANTSSS